MKLPPRRYLFAALIALAAGVYYLQVYVVQAEKFGFSEHMELWMDSAPVAVLESPSPSLMGEYCELEGKEREILYNAGLVDNSLPFVIGFPALATIILVIDDLLRRREFLRRCFLAFVLAEGLGLMALVGWTLTENKSASQILEIKCKSDPLHCDEAFRLQAKARPLAIELDLLNNAIPFLVIPAVFAFTCVLTDAHRRRLLEGSKANSIKN
jgi:hypothetical protein